MGTDSCRSHQAGDAGEGVSETRPPECRTRFTLDDVERAAADWHCNCGPASIAAIAALTLDELRPMLGDFESKGYTNPTLMWEILGRLPLLWARAQLVWPRWGLVRIQWEGPWTKPGVPARAAYRHTHWVGSRRRDGRTDIFDVNAMCVSGWVPLAEWTDQLVPWLLSECEPKADGRWNMTHAVEIQRPTA